MLYRYYTISWYIMCVLLLCVIRCVSTWYLSIIIRNEKIRKYNIVDRVARREQRPRVGNTVELIKRALPMYL